MGRQKFSTRRQPSSPEGGASVGAPSKWQRGSWLSQGREHRSSPRAATPLQGRSLSPPAACPMPILQQAVLGTDPSSRSTLHSKAAAARLLKTAPDSGGEESAQGNTPGQMTTDRTLVCQISYALLLALLRASWGKWSILSWVCLPLPLQIV